MKAWTFVVTREHNIPADPDPLMFDGIAEVTAALRDRRIDAVSLTAEEYGALGGTLSLSPIFVARISGSLAEEIVLLVHRDSGITDLSQLRGRTLNTHKSPRASLATVWLETIFAQHGLPKPSEFLGRVSTNTKLPGVILPVFFRQVDACLVTSSAFDSTNELNPQIGKTLRVIATSPAIVPVILGFRPDYAPPFKAKLLDGLRSLHLTPTGTQVLTIFRSERLEEQPAECMASALELLATHRRLYDGKSVPLPSPPYSPRPADTPRTP